MSKDISKLLREWEPEDESKAVRLIIGVDGRKKIQRRIDLGILQMEVEGRPDGIRPHGFPSYYDYFKWQAEMQETDLPENEYSLAKEQCELLQTEALLYYQRRLCFFELRDYAGAARDARRNLEVFEFVRKFAEDEEDKLAMDQYRAFVISHRVKAEVLDALESGRFDDALRYIDVGEKELRDFFMEYGREDLLESSDEMRYLRGLRGKVLELRPLSSTELLKRQLAEAIELEDYERAARIRDEIRRLEEGLEDERTT